jgi:hypothetical protein
MRNRAFSFCILFLSCAYILVGMYNFKTQLIKSDCRKIEIADAIEKTHSIVESVEQMIQEFDEKSFPLENYRGHKNEYVLIYCTIYAEILGPKRGRWRPPSTKWRLPHWTMEKKHSPWAGKKFCRRNRRYLHWRVQI